MRKNWALLFSRLDTDGSGRLDYWEFRRALIDVLEISITEKEAKGSGPTSTTTRAAWCPSRSSSTRVIC